MTTPSPQPTGSAATIRWMLVLMKELTGDRRVDRLIDDSPLGVSDDWRVAARQHWWVEVLSDLRAEHALAAYQYAARHLCSSVAQAPLTLLLLDGMARRRMARLGLPEPGADAATELHRVHEALNTVIAWEYAIDPGTSAYDRIDEAVDRAQARNEFAGATLPHHGIAADPQRPLPSGPETA